MCRALAIGLGTGLLAASGTDEAQRPRPSAASELFHKGRVAFDAEEYATTSHKLEVSLRLDPHVGTLMNLAECEETTKRSEDARVEVAPELLGASVSVSRGVVTGTIWRASRRHHGSPTLYSSAEAEKRCGWAF
jgi:hypothetical protein